MSTCHATFLQLCTPSSSAPFLTLAPSFSHTHNTHTPAHVCHDQTTNNFGVQLQTTWKSAEADRILKDSGKFIPVSFQDLLHLLFCHLNVLLLQLLFLLFVPFFLFRFLPPKSLSPPDLTTSPPPAPANQHRCSGALLLLLLLMELKVWVEGVARVVCGVSLTTSCQDVVVALAQATGELPAVPGKQLLLPSILLKFSLYFIRSDWTLPFCTEALCRRAPPGGR